MRWRTGGESTGLLIPPDEPHLPASAALQQAITDDSAVNDWLIEDILQAPSIMSGDLRA